MSNLTEIAVPKGGTGFYTFTLIQNGLPIDLTGKSLTFTVVDYAGATTQRFRKRNTAAGGSNAEIEVTDAVNGVCKVYFVETDTLSMPHGVYFCDMWMDSVSDHLQVVPVTPFRVKTRAKLGS